MDAKTKIDSALTAAKHYESKLNDEILNIEGLTSHKVKHFLNNIVTDNVYYVEVGTNRGATLCSACYGNNVTATGIDNFSQENIQPDRQDLSITYSNNTTKEDLLNNINKFNIDADIIENSFSDITQEDLRGKIDVFFYDGDHSVSEQIKVLKHFQHMFNDKVIVIIDDWNWTEVKEGTILGLKAINYKVKAMKTITTRGEDSNDFWNGLGIFYLEINS